ncbi:MAG: PhnD/SsuA/transferrin family substrate-binding protein [Gammaproteobacteria bacterium]|nr:PhnD/SsuA/transferrin family substrate-binding protein [Gammaproteobacteria bacterium]
MFETAFADSVDGLSVGIFPRRDSQTTREMFEPLMEYLSQELDLEVSLDVPPDFEAFWVRLRENRYDLVHLNQYQYLRAHQLYGYEAILRNEEMGRSEIATVIWVRQGEGIDRPRDLKGKKVIFGGGRQAMVSYIMAVDLLREHGLEDDEYLMEFALNPVSAVLSLYYRQSVAAGSGDILPQLLAIREPIPVDAFKPLLKSRPVAQLPWAVSPTLTEKHSGQIMHALTQLKQTIGGQQLLVGAGLTGIVLATDSDYDPHRRIVARVLMEQY